MSLRRQFPSVTLPVRDSPSLFKTIRRLQGPRLMSLFSDVTL